MVRQILIQWELPNCRINLNRDDVEISLPRVTGQKYTFSCFHGAKLSQHVTPWVGACPDNFRFEVLLGQACYLSIVHEKGKTNDNVYANIASVMKVPAGTAVPEQENPDIFYDLPAMKKDFPESMMGDNYKWLRELIEGSQEFNDPNLDYVGDGPPPATDADVPNENEIPI